VLDAVLASMDAEGAASMDPEAGAKVPTARSQAEKSEVRN
jgi:hypothetical protein